jgi:hypothetical protein
MPRRKFDIMQWCSGSNKSNQACESNVQYAKQATGGNDPSITKAMRYAQYVRNSKPHGTTITRINSLQSQQQQFVTLSTLG